MKFILLSLVFFSSHFFANAASSLVKDEYKKCLEHSGEALSVHPYTMYSALCGENRTLWLAKGADFDSAVILDKIILPKLAKDEEFQQPICYFKGNSKNQLTYFGIFDTKKSGTFKSGPGKMVKAYTPDTKKEKFVLLSTESLNKVICENDEEGE